MQAFRHIIHRLSHSDKRQQEISNFFHAFEFISVSTVEQFNLQQTNLVKLTLFSQSTMPHLISLVCCGKEHHVQIQRWL